MALTCIIDDDAIHHFGMKMMMRRLEINQEIIFFNNGQEAIDGLIQLMEQGQELPSVIFLDLNMPVKDGWEFLEDFIKIPQEFREKVMVYVLSSSIDPLDEERAKTYEVVGNYLTKPMDESQLKLVMGAVA